MSKADNVSGVGWRVELLVWLVVFIDVWLLVVDDVWLFV
jgi:hypothetical protein